jgi:hypothetical protein
VTSRGVGLHIECSCPLRPLVEAWLRVVLLARDGHRRGENDGSVEWGPWAGRGFPQVHPLSEGRLERGRVLCDCRVVPRASRGLYLIVLGECA